MLRVQQGDRNRRGGCSLSAPKSADCPHGICRAPANPRVILRREDKRPRSAARRDREKALEGDDDSGADASREREQLRR